ncbi:glycosyltransferase family 4 protein [Flavobacterium nitratireducens]|uniref:glycosyltransferase family 4 protein n=1 Tax=Flavobacterium nitratireducens TaxID=992289 RepID=UPI00241528DE|nr:glycosyltransferase family 4 protein [Flavobacterium nitratireducens]
MKLIVFSSAPIIKLEGKLHMYAPYEKEMQLWAKFVDEIIFCCPVWNEDRDLLISELNFSTSRLIPLSEFSIKSIKLAFQSIAKVLKNVLIIFKVMQQADHIHLRCPGNVGLLACFLQILFPSKPKTAKYAGNWDPKAKQPWSYRLQKWLLANTFLTRNMKVLVYGEWSNQSVNITPFFTASYSEKEIVVEPKKIQANKTIRLLFVGSLVEGKNPLYTIQLLEQLRAKQINAVLDIYGEGVLRSSLEHYIVENQLQEYVILHGNQNQEVLKKAYQESHFVVLASKSEGWPKAIAEAMFWGSVPIATSVSCIPFMLDDGNRGIILQKKLDKDAEAVLRLINNAADYENKSAAAIHWSRKYTLERFELEIQKLIR